jgi:hypothetical protein
MWIPKNYDKDKKVEKKTFKSSLQYKNILMNDVNEQCDIKQS